MTTTTQKLAGIKAWRESNPLYAWRQANKVGRQTVAGALGVTHTAVVAWEAGSNQPTGVHMIAISDLLEQTVTAVEVAWAAWREKRPA